MIVSTFDPWMMGGIILAFIIVIAGVIWLIHRKKVASDNLTPIESKELGSHSIQMKTE